MSYLMGIDVGSTGTRAVIVRPDGTVVGAATGDHQPMRMDNPGWAEQDPEDWWEATTFAVQGALIEAGLKGSDIKAVGLSGQMHGVVLLDGANAVLRPALIWCDQRSQPQCDWITAQVGSERLIQLVSNPALTGFSAPKLLWIRDHEPAIFDRAAHFLLPKDFVRYRLTGEFATDVSAASGTLLFDVSNRRWSQEMLSALGIDPELLPQVYESPKITGTVTREAALLTGLVAGTPVVGGAGDQGGGLVDSGGPAMRRRIRRVQAPRDSRRRQRLVAGGPNRGAAGQIALGSGLPAQYRDPGPRLGRRHLHAAMLRTRHGRAPSGPPRCACRPGAGAPGPMVHHSAVTHAPRCPLCGTPAAYWPGGDAWACPGTGCAHRIGIATADTAAAAILAALTGPPPARAGGWLRRLLTPRRERETK